MYRIFTFILSFFGSSDLLNDESLSGLSSQLQQGRPQHLLGDVQVYADHREWVEPMSAASPHEGVKIVGRQDWVIKCDSEKDKAHSCDKVVDGKESTFWFADRDPASGFNFITIDLGSRHNVSGIAVKPRQDGSEHGNIAEHEIYLSEDGYIWNDPIAYGTWWSDRTEKFSNFEALPARYVNLVILSDATSSSHAAISDLNVYVDPSYSGSPFEAGDLGVWGPTVNTPIVPVTGIVDPFSHKVIFISSKRHDNFAQDRPDFTLISTWDPKSQSLSQARIEHTHHNMFCPGTTFDANGRMIVSGGSTGTVVSIFDGQAAEEDQWTQAADMVYTRGYHGAVLNPDGRMFVIGGSWGDLALIDPEQRKKNGEIYDPTTDTWTLLPKCLADKMITQDRQRYRRDNHPWLFAWKNNTIFHAGPSKNMNWYTITGKGGWKSAGPRMSSDGFADKDAMNGQAVMYDATKGKILAFGGAEHYLGAGLASNNAFILTLGEPNGTVQVERVESMGHNRTYATAVVVPNGDVLITGGQHGVPVVFNDTNPVLQVEVFSPKTGHWTKLAHNSIVRVYHSITLLLPDARVLSGGSGLCGDSCAVNHFDAQIFTPPYLLTPDGRPAKRPVIKKVSTSQVKPGGSVVVTTDYKVEEASLIRYGATTHTVNNDQKRIPLSLTQVGPLQYKFEIPPEGYVSIPGYWMLFVMDKYGVPSVAETIKIYIADNV